MKLQAKLSVNLCFSDITYSFTRKLVRRIGWPADPVCNLSWSEDVPENKNSMTEPLYMVLNNRPLAQGMSANAHIKSYCFTDISLTSKCLWRTCDLPWGFRNYSESKNKKDGGREWRQRHQFTLQRNIIASYFWQETYKSRDIGMVVELCSVPPLPFKSIKPEIMVPFGDERHVTETVPLL